MRNYLLLTVLLISSNHLVWADGFEPKTIYQKTSPSVVLITGSNPGDKSKSIGTGSIINENGLVITNAHVVYNLEQNKPYQNIIVYLKPRRLIGELEKDTSIRHSAILVNYSKTLDLAILRITDAVILKEPPLTFADSDQVQVGERVLAIGHPEQGGLWTLTTGTISSQIRDFQSVQGKHVFQTETSINRGNSGGPLINSKGEIVGINSNLARKGKNGVVITDINFSIKSNVAARWLSNIGYAPSLLGSRSNKDNTNRKLQHTKIIPVPIVKSERLSSKLVKKRKPLIKLKTYKKENLFQRVETEMENLMKSMKARTTQKIRD